MNKINYILSLIFCTITIIFCGCQEEENQPQLIMVTEATFPPYEYRKGDEIVGIDPEIVRYIAEKNGYKLTITDLNFDSIITAVQTGKADIGASGITITEDRKNKINFTIPYVESKQAIIVHKDSTIKDANNLANKRIGVQHGTTGDTYVTNNIKDPERFTNGALAVSALVANKLDVVILDEKPSKVLVSKRSNIKILETSLTSEEYAFAINKNNPKLLKQFNATLKEMKDSGILAQILKKYKTEINEESIVKTEENKNFIQKIKDNLKLNFVKDGRYKYLLKGFWTTIIISFFSVILGTIIGFFVAIIRSTSDQTGRLKILNWLCKIYLTIIRGTPVVVQLLIIYFVIFGSWNISKVLVAIIAFGINSGAYVAEIMRGGIMAIDAGQFEAGRSLGLSYTQTIRYIILPQTIKNVLPALGNEFIVLLKETSVSGYIAIQDLTKGGDIIRSQTYDAFLPLIAVALIYLAVVTLFTWIMSRFEERLKVNEK